MGEGVGVWAWFLPSMPVLDSGLPRGWARKRPPAGVFDEIRSRRHFRGKSRHLWLRVAKGGRRLFSDDGWGWWFVYTGSSLWPEYLPGFSGEADREAERQPRTARGENIEHVDDRSLKSDDKVFILLPGHIFTPQVYAGSQENPRSSEVAFIILFEPNLWFYLPDHDEFDIHCSLGYRLQCHVRNTHPWNSQAFINVTVFPVE